MRRYHKKAIRRMLGIEEDRKAEIPPHVVKAVDRAEMYLSRIGKQRDFLYENLALLLAAVILRPGDEVAEEPAEAEVKAPAESKEPVEV